MKIERRPGSSPDRRRAGIARVKPHGVPAPIDPEWSAHAWRLKPLVRKAVHVYTSTPHPGSIVAPWWMPTGLLTTMLAEYDVPEPVVKATLDALESDGLIEQRYMTINSVVHPVACLTDEGRFGYGMEIDMQADLAALTAARQQIAPTRKEIGP